MSHRGTGQLSGVTTIQRLNTKGGVAEGPCETAGTFLNVPYSSDYAYLRRADSGTRSIPAQPINRSTGA